MGYELSRMISAGAPRSWTAAMRLVAKEIADDARDPSASDLREGELPWSRIPIEGHFIKKGPNRGQWRDGLVERTGLSKSHIRTALTMLAKAGYEMRKPLTDDDGNVVLSKEKPAKDGKKAQPARVMFTIKGKQLTFIVPPLPPRPCPVATQADARGEMDETADDTDEAETESPEPAKVTADGHLETAGGHLNASKVTADGHPSPHPPTVGGSPPGSPQTNGSVVNGSEESTQRPVAKEPDFQPSFLIGVPDGPTSVGGTVRTRPSRWRDPRQTALDQLAASRARRERAQRAGDAPGPLAAGL